MTEIKRRYRTTIAGREYTILAKKPVEHLDVVSEIVNDKIVQIKEAMPILDIEQQSVLVSINAVSESIEKQEEIDRLKKMISVLEKENDCENQQSVPLENSSRLNPTQTESQGKQRDGNRGSSNKKTSSHFVRPTTVSGVVLHRENLNQQKQNKEVPPYSKKKREVQFKQSNRFQEER